FLDNLDDLDLDLDDLGLGRGSLDDRGRTLQDGRPSAASTRPGRRLELDVLGPASFHGYVPGDSTNQDHSDHKDDEHGHGASLREPPVLAAVGHRNGAPLQPVRNVGVVQAPAVTRSDTTREEPPGCMVTP